MGEWIPAISTTGILALVLWLSRNLIKTRLTASVGHEFDEKLERVRTELRQGEERLRADLRAREAEIVALRGGAMSALASRQIAVDKRRLEAVDQLWSSALALAPARALSSGLAVVKFEAAAERAERDPKFRQLFEMMGDNFDTKSLGSNDAQKARPYVSPMAWSIFTALQAICSLAAMRWQILKSGLGKQDFADVESINKLLKTALPHQVAYIDKYGPEGYHYLLEELDAKLLTELQAMIVGGEADKANLDQAAEILKQSNYILKKATEPGKA